MTVKCKPGELAIVTKNPGTLGCTCMDCAVSRAMVGKIVRVGKLIEPTVWLLTEKLRVEAMMTETLGARVTVDAIDDDLLTPIRGEPEGESTDTPIGHRIPDTVH
ncbi:hypothetical protein [Robbsia sp. KACC 23696]|uniref:hypothetical protein n=1 Tax=Robbsia sp. KACC 23696 TaxID=3149231 RepID=UPI00325B69A4